MLAATVFVIVANIPVDIAYAMLDPASGSQPATGSSLSSASSAASRGWHLTRSRNSATAYGAEMELPGPLVLVDVDGVLNPARSHALGYRRHWVFPAGLAHRLLLNPSHGPMLTELAGAAGAELVWASYWRNRANTWVAPRVGPRPFVWFEDDPDAASQLARQPDLGRHLMVKVDPVTGLTDSHMEQARAWLDSLHR